MDRSDDGQEAPRGQLFRDKFDCFFASHHSVRPWGQSDGRRDERISQERRRACSARNRRDKTVAAARHIGHIAFTRLPFAEGLAQRRNVIAKVTLIDHKVRPYPSEELLLGNHLGRAFEESDENIESSAAKPNRDATFYEDPLRGGQTKRTKTDHVLRRTPFKLHIHDIHLFSPFRFRRRDVLSERDRTNLS